VNAILAIARREVAAYFATPIGWICLCAFVFVTGLWFVIGLLQYLDYAAQMMFNPMQADQFNVNDAFVKPMFDFMGTIALFMTPALTMRLFAEDRRSRAMELLLTSPVSSLEIVLGKFLGAMGFAAVLAASTLHLPALLLWLGEPDPNMIAAGYVSFLLLLATYMAIGLLASSTTENQIVALVVAFSVNLFLYIVGWLVFSADDGALKTVVEAVAMPSHVDRLAKGLVHVEDLVYFLTFTGFCLFATTQRVEALRWR
jgi:ABC-2 type transport system permease protein